MVMKLLGRNKLQLLRGLDTTTDVWLVNWISEVVNASWKHPDDVIRQFPSVTAANADVFLFRVASQPRSIQLSIMFPLSIAVVTDLKDMS